MQRFEIFLLLMLLMLCAPGSMHLGSAETPAGAFASTRNQDSFDADISNIRKLLDRQLSPAQREIYRQVEFTGAQWPSAVPFARKNGNRREIVFSIGAYEVFTQIVSAMILEHALGRAGSAEKYARYIAKELQANDARRAAGQPPSAPLTYPEYMKVPPEEVERVYSAEGLRRLRELVFIDLTFVLAHEIGHHVLGHFEAPALSVRQREDDADQFAAIIGTKAGLNPFLTRAPFYFQAGLIDPDGLSLRAYSAPRCRVARFGAIGGRTALNDAAFVKALTDAKQLEMFATAATDAERFLREKCL